MRTRLRTYSLQQITYSLQQKSWKESLGSSEGSVSALLHKNKDSIVLDSLILNRISMSKMLFATWIGLRKKTTTSPSFPLQNLHFRYVHLDLWGSFFAGQSKWKNASPRCNERKSPCRWSHWWWCWRWCHVRMPDQRQWIRQQSNEPLTMLEV